MSSTYTCIHIYFTSGLLWCCPLVFVIVIQLVESRFCLKIATYLVSTALRDSIKRGFIKICDFQEHHNIG